MRRKLAYLLRKIATRLAPAWCESCEAPMTVCRGRCGPPITISRHTLGRLLGYQTMPRKGRAS